DVVIQVARRYWTLGQVSAAKKELRDLQKIIKGRHSLAAIYWIYGRMAEEQRNYKSAIANFNIALAEPASKAKKEEYLWYRSWSYRKLGDYKNSLVDLQTLLESKNEPDAKFVYWKAKTEKDLELLQEATLSFERVIELDPYGYYGTLSYREL